MPSCLLGRSRAPLRRQVPPAPARHLRHRRRGRDDPEEPCLLRGASTDRPAERPVGTIAQVFAIADAIGPSLRVQFIFATFTGLRFGELRALKRSRVDLLHKSVQVVEQYQELSSGQLVLGLPKTDAGRRTVAIPDILVTYLEEHIATYSGQGTDGLVFCGTQHQPLHRKTFYRNWNKATAVAGLPGFHLHDLRHTGNTLAAATGASTKKLMSRMGHASPQAALTYQDATKDRDAAIAAALSKLISEGAPKPSSGTQRIAEPGRCSHRVLMIIEDDQVSISRDERRDASGSSQGDNELVIWITHGLGTRWRRVGDHLGKLPYGSDELLRLTLGEPVGHPREVEDLGLGASGFSVGEFFAQMFAGAQVRAPATMGPCVTPSCTVSCWESLHHGR